MYAKKNQDTNLLRTKIRKIEINFVYINKWSIFKSKGYYFCGRKKEAQMHISMTEGACV